MMIGTNIMEEPKPKVVIDPILFARIERRLQWLEQNAPGAGLAIDVNAFARDVRDAMSSAIRTLPPDEEVPCMTCACEQLAKDYNDQRRAGNELAEAAMRVINTYDGVHRLGLAVSTWTRVVASEGNRAALDKEGGDR